MEKKIKDYMAKAITTIIDMLASEDTAVGDNFTIMGVELTVTKIDE